MLSKEGIENKINLKDRTKYAIEKSKKIIKKHKEEKGDCSIEVSLAYDMQYVEEYIDQLESDKQKLIEKLEEAIDFTKTSKDLTSKAKIEVLENVLKVLKGE